jgi:hypothetical protein
MVRSEELDRLRAYGLPLAAWSGPDEVWRRWDAVRAAGVGLPAGPFDEAGQAFDRGFHALLEIRRTLQVYQLAYDRKEAAGARIDLRAMVECVQAGSTFRLSSALWSPVRPAALTARLDALGVLAAGRALVSARKGSETVYLAEGLLCVGSHVYAGKAAERFEDALERTAGLSPRGTTRFAMVPSRAAIRVTRLYDVGRLEVHEVEAELRF